MEGGRTEVISCRSASRVRRRALLFRPRCRWFGDPRVWPSRAALLTFLFPACLRQAASRCRRVRIPRTPHRAEQRDDSLLRSPASTIERPRLPWKFTVRLHASRFLRVRRRSPGTSPRDSTDHHEKFVAMIGDHLFRGAYLSQFAFRGILQVATANPSNPKQPYRNHGKAHLRFGLVSRPLAIPRQKPSGLRSSQQYDPSCHLEHKARVSKLTAETSVFDEPAKPLHVSCALLLRQLSDNQ